MVQRETISPRPAPWQTHGRHTRVGAGAGADAGLVVVVVVAARAGAGDADRVCEAADGVLQHLLVPVVLALLPRPVQSRVKGAQPDSLRLLHHVIAVRAR